MGVKKLVKLKIFVLTMRFVEWLGIDLGMLKLIKKIMNDFFWGDFTVLRTPSKN